MSSGEMEVMLGAWAPHHNDMINPLVAAGKLERVATNQKDSKTSLCVPSYVWDAGVHSFADLDSNAEKFNKTIYNLEAGSGMNTAMENIMDKNIAGLQDWEQVGSNLAAMMMEVGAQIKQQKWVVFGCWAPHWMNSIYDIKYLDGVAGTEAFVNEPSIDTVVNTEFSVQFPQVYKFLQQFSVSAATESQWIYAFSYDKNEAEQVARDWIAANLDTVAVWLEGVNGPDGQPAIKAIKAAF